MEAAGENNLGATLDRVSVRTASILVHGGSVLRNINKTTTSKKTKQTNDDHGGEFVSSIRFAACVSDHHKAFFSTNILSYRVNAVGSHRRPPIS